MQTRPQKPLTIREKQMLALVTLAAGSYPAMQAKDPHPVVEAWVVMLADFPYEILHTAVIKACRESEFFPSVAQIVAAAKTVDPRQEKSISAGDAWAEVYRAAQTVGPYRSPKWSSQAVARAVAAIGWTNLCCGENVEADRAHFLRIYEQMREAKRDEAETQRSLELSGMSDKIKALADGMRVLARKADAT